MQDSFSQLFQTIKSSQVRMEDKFVQFQYKVQLGQEEATVKVLKMAWYEKPYVHVYSVVHYVAMTFKIVIACFRMGAYTREAVAHTRYGCVYSWCAYSQ